MNSPEPPEIIPNPITPDEAKAAAVNHRELIDIARQLSASGVSEETRTTLEAREREIEEALDVFYSKHGRELLNAWMIINNEYAPLVSAFEAVVRRLAISQALQAKVQTGEPR